MKKITAMLLSLILVLALVGCGEEPEPNEIAALFDEGYTCTSTTYDESSWTGVLQKDGGWDKVYLAKASMTSKQYEEYSAISFEDEDYEAKQMQLIGILSDATVTDITDRLPSQEELDSYVGMTMGELEDMGFESTGYIGTPDTGYEFFYDGPDYSLTVTPVDSESMGSLDDYSLNDLRELEIASVEFSNFSYQILEG